jgi:hypothetical protein
VRRDLLQRFGHRAQVTHAVIDDCDARHDGG